MMTRPIDPEFLCHPTVCAVGENYHILLPVKSDLLLWVSVGGEDFYDASNGILRSSVRIHRVILPAKVLDQAEGYTVVYRKVIERRAYFPLSEEEVRIFYPFRPLKKTRDIHIYQLADTHGMIESPAAAAGYFGEELDLLLLNGDIADHSGSVENLCVAYQIASRVTGGSIPCVFSRGNHDLRGACAENLAEYTPNENGNSYYSFRVGCVWGVLLDCGEDKADSHPAYGHTICCSAFRRQQTRYLEALASDPKRHYEADGICYRLAVSHVPFTYDNREEEDGGTPFDIEKELYAGWARILKETVKPQLILCGHLHQLFVSPVGGPYDHKGQPCPVVVGSRPDFKTRQYAGTALTLFEDRAEILFTDQDKTVLHSETVLL